MATRKAKDKNPFMAAYFETAGKNCIDTLLARVGEGGD